MVGPLAFPLQTTMEAPAPVVQVVVPIRHRILRLVEESPGLSKSDVRVSVGVAWGTVSYHVDRLCREGRLHAQARGRCVALFPAHDPRGHSGAPAILREPKAQEVLRFLQQVRQASMSDVAAALAMSRKVARRLLRGLVATGLVENTALGQPRYVLARAPASVGNLVALATSRSGHMMDSKTGDLLAC